MLLLLDFWIFLLFFAFFGWTMILSEYDATEIFWVSIFVGLVILWIFGYDVIGFLTNPVYLLSSVAGYLVAGGLWSLFKWNNYVNSEHVQDRVKGWLSVDRQPFGIHNKEDREAKAREILTPDKRKITAWISMWPASMVMYFFKDMLRHLWNAVYNHLVKLYTRISDKAFDRIKNS